MIRAAVVVALLLVLVELYLQARNYAWLDDFFDADTGVLRSERMPVSLAAIRSVWIVTLPVYVVAVVLASGAHRLVGALGLASFAGSLWLTPSKMTAVPWTDAETFARESIGRPDTGYQAALVLIVVSALALLVLMLTARDRRL